MLHAKLITDRSYCACPVTAPAAAGGADWPSTHCHPSIKATSIPASTVIYFRDIGEGYKTGGSREVLSGTWEQHE